MADHSKIEWTDATWNPITGCAIVSPGCTNCYAMKLAGSRLKHHPSRAGLTRDTKAGPVWTGEVRFNEQWLDQPLRWTKPRMIFVCAHGDLFAEGVTDAMLDKVFAVMALAPQHTFQVLTKRPERMRNYIMDLPWRREGDRAYPLNPLETAAHSIYHALGRDPDFAATRAFEAVQQRPLPNVWLGISAEDQTRADERVPILLDTPAAIRWVSAEPLLGPIDFTSIDLGTECLDALAGYKALHGQENDLCDAGASLDWIVAGGESGRGARPMHPDWVRAIRDACAAAGVPFLFKQWGEWAPGEIAGPNERAIDAATWFYDRWLLHRVGKSQPDDHRDDEPDLFRIGKTRAGRLLDGVTHDSYPARAA